MKLKTRISPWLKMFWIPTRFSDIVGIPQVDMIQKIVTQIEPNLICSWHGCVVIVLIPNRFILLLFSVLFCSNFVAKEKDMVISHYYVSFLSWHRRSLIGTVIRISISGFQIVTCYTNSIQINPIFFIYTEDEVLNLEATSNSVSIIVQSHSSLLIL